MVKFNSRKFYWSLIMLAVGLFFLLRLPQVLRGEFAFVFDMGRDHIWVRNMVELKKITLIGPWGSLAGVYMGPAWYYFLTIPYIIGSGDPRASVIGVMLANLAAMLVGVWFLKKEISIRSAIIFAFLFALSPQNINITTYPFHANMLPITLTAMLISLYYVLHGPAVYLWVAGLATSLNFHFEPAAGIFTTLTLLIFIIWHRQKLTIKSLIHTIMAFGIPFLPQFIFEFRHNFIQTKAALLYFQGQNQSLEGKLPFFERIVERLRKFSELFLSSIAPGTIPIIAGAILLITIFWLWRTKKTKSENQLLSLIFIHLLIPLVGFMFLFPPELKGWYLYGFSICYFMLIAIFLSKIISHFLISSAVSVRIGSTLLLILYFFWLGQLHNRLPNLFTPKLIGPETLATQEDLVKTLYQKSPKPFSVYVYTPPIYDYQYQYLIWLFARKNHLPLPVEYSYLPSETSYIPYKDQFVNQTKLTPVTIFLIIEPEKDLSRLNGWLGHFAQYKMLSETKLTSGITLQTRESNN